MSGVAVAIDARIEREAFVAAGLDPDLVGIDLARPDLEFLRPVFAVLRVALAFLRQQQIVERRDGTVMEIRRRRPDAVQGSRPVGEERSVGRGGGGRLVVTASDRRLDV